MTGNFELYMARRHLQSGRRSAFISTIAIIAGAGIMVGTAALIVVISVMGGYEIELRNMIMGLNAHGNAVKLTGTFHHYKEQVKTVESTKGVQHAGAFILREVMLTSKGGVGGILIKGIEPEKAALVNDLSRYIRPARDGVQEVGNYKWLGDPEGLLKWTQEKRKNEKTAEPVKGAVEDKPAAYEFDPRAKQRDQVLSAIVIGRQMAKQLKVEVGDEVNVVNPLGGGIGPTGPQPSNRWFRVGGIFYSGMYEYDLKFAFTDLGSLQSFANMDDDEAMAVEFKVDEDKILDTSAIAAEVEERLGGFPYKVRDWREMNHNLFSALKLERFTMFIILAFITLVAAFNIASTLIMMVIEKTKEIAILKSMGAGQLSIMKIFMTDGLFIGAAGSSAGLLLGLLLCSMIPFLNRQLDLLDPTVYFMAELPVKVEPLYLATVVVLAVFISLLATIYPALQAARMTPVEGLRND